MSIPLRLVAQDLPTGPIPPAAAHTAEGLRQLPGVAGTGQVPDVETVTAHVTEIEAARERLVAAIDNVDILL